MLLAGAHWSLLCMSEAGDKASLGGASQGKQENSTWQWSIFRVPMERCESLGQTIGLEAKSSLCTVMTLCCIKCGVGGLASSLAFPA